MAAANPRHRHRSPVRDLVQERRKGFRVVVVVVAGFSIVFFSIGGLVVLPLFFQPPHAVMIPLVYGADADFPANQYAAAEAAGAGFYFGLPAVFIALGVYAYLGMLADLPRLAAQTEANRAARRALEEREGSSPEQ